MRFLNPYYFFILILLLPLMVLFIVFTFKNRQKLIEKFCNSIVIPKIIQGNLFKRRIIKNILLVFAVIFAFIALAQPQWGWKTEEINREGVDIYIAVDVSRSMLAQDMQPSRLEQAKRELIDFIQNLQGDRVGLVLFAGSSFIQCPLTMDYDTLNMFIDTISVYSVPVKGTAIGSAIQSCLDSFKRSAESSSKAIVLISDGEDHLGNALAEAKKAKNDGVVIYTIGIGTTTGASIPDVNGVKRDLFGNVINTKANFEQLKQISAITGGLFINSVPDNSDFDYIYLNGIKKKLKSHGLKTVRQKLWIERFQWPLAIALLLLCIELIIAEKGRLKKVKVAGSKSK